MAKYLTTAQAAAILGVTDGRIKQLRPVHFPGSYEPVGPGKGWLIPAIEVERYRRKSLAGKLPKAGWPKGKRRKELGESESAGQ